MKSLIALISAISAIAFAGYGKDEPDPGPRDNEAVIQSVQYEVRAARYFDGYYEFIGEDCVCLHLEFTQNGVNTGAGMTVEISKTLLGQRIPIEPSESFWFFHVGTGRASLSLENTHGPERFDRRGGWFSVDYGDQEDEIVFEWLLTNNNGAVETSRGYIRTVFVRE